MQKKHKLIGAPIDRIDGRLKVTGKATYAAEFPMASRRRFENYYPPKRFETRTAPSGDIHQSADTRQPGFTGHENQLLRAVYRFDRCRNLRAGAARSQSRQDFVQSRKTEN